MAGLDWKKWRGDSAAAHFAPLMIFLVFMGAVQLLTGQFAPTFFRDHPDLPWWRQKSDYWSYPAQCLVCLGFLAFWWKHYRFNWSPRAIVLGAIFGAVGIGFWILPTQLFEWMGYATDEEVPTWLQKLGVAERREGFEGCIFGASPTDFDCSADFLVIGLRFFRAVVVVSLVEEICWRGFLMRWLLNRDGDFREVPFGKPSWLTFGVVTLAFMLAHAPVDYAGAIVFGTLMYLCAIWTKSLGACIVAHAVANALMGWYALACDKAGLW